MSGKRDQSIDVFRGMAILLVVLFHFTARLPHEALNITEDAPLPITFGWVGVYFFFIISGYCIFMTLERSASAGQFLARRISRIYPAFAAAVLSLFVFGMIFTIPSVPAANFHEVEPGILDVVLNLLFIGEVGEWVNGSFWSIAVEVKFYALVAIMAFLVPERGQFGRLFGLFAIVMGLIWAGSTLVSGSGSITPQSLMKFLTIAPYLPFFAVGMLGWQYEQGRAGTGRLLAANLVLSTLIVWVEAYSFELHEGWLIASACALVYLALALLFIRHIRGGRLPIVPGLTWAMAQIGLLSFSWYLIHETIGMSMLATLDRYLPAQIVLWIVVLSTFVMTIVFANLFEWRFRKPVERAITGIWTWLGTRLAAFRTSARRQPIQ